MKLIYKVDSKALYFFLAATITSSQPKKSNNGFLGMDVVLLRESAPYISESLASVINKSLESGVFEQDYL